MHVVPGLDVLSLGIPVVPVSTRIENGTADLAPISSAWWLGQYAVLGLGDAARTTADLPRERECVLSLPTPEPADAVDRLALTTGRPDVPRRRAKQGHRYEPETCAAAHLTEQPSELVRAPRVAECPVPPECRVVAAHRLGGPGAHATAFQAEAPRTHVEEGLVTPGTPHVDPDGWDPLIMKFCEFHGGGHRLRPSRPADGRNTPHQRPGGERTARTGTA
ncbi:hypothetical protein EES47_06330 [Streptomyces sp. ADI98-12]|uniref:flavin reductase n=1 Tax=Streptomyces TaxID=1883 RepID=UPI000F556CB4|nr:flavin reductase [Streptomyces sp. ADI98-12]RPK91312.1 hypothetical protein EES47_06330 [Streptomyces sp. ADI98-12]